MDKQFYRKMLPLVNDPAVYDLLQEYIDARIEQYRDHLEKLGGWEEIQKMQGKIAELRRLQHLKEEIQQEAK